MMAFKLKKAQVAEFNALTAKHTEAAEALNESIATVNEKIAEMYLSLQEPAEAYNNALGDLREFCEGVASEAEDEIGDKSDSWQESERGEAATAWKDAWEQVDLQDFELPFVSSEIDDAEDYTETLGELPQELEP